MGEIKRKTKKRIRGRKKVNLKNKAIWKLDCV